MRRSTRMMLMKHDGQRRKEYDDGPRSWEPEEDRFRDRRGREHYDDGRYAPQNSAGDDRYRPRGPYYPGDHERKMWYDGENAPRGSRYPGPYFPPYYGGGNDLEPPKMNKIGFSVDGEMERYPDEFRRDYRSTMDHPQRDEMQHRKGSYMAGHGAGNRVPPMDKETAERWAAAMENEDGSTGPHWTMEQTKQVQSQKGIDCDPVHFWVAMNMVYSDYGKVAKKLSVNNADFYAGMAEAFLDDKDAQPDKLERYYQYVVKH